MRQEELEHLAALSAELFGSLTTQQATLAVVAPSSLPQLRKAVEESFGELETGAKADQLVLLKELFFRQKNGLS